MEICGGELHGLGGFGGVLAMFPKDGGAAFRADHRVIGVFEHEDAVGDADAERAAGAALAEDHGDDGRSQAHHLAKVEGDGLGDIALLGLDPREGAGGVDERDDRQVEISPRGA